jgi:hypothetical protein
MNCDGVRDLLSAYLDGELSPGELLRVEQHLRRCHCCADEVDSLRQTIALVASLDEVEVPASFHAQLHERLVAIGPPAAVRRPPAASSRQSGVRRWAVPAAAAAAVLAIGLSTYPNVMNTPEGILKFSVMADQKPTPTDVAIAPSNPGADKQNATAENAQSTKAADPQPVTGDQPVSPKETATAPKAGDQTAVGGPGAPAGDLVRDPGAAVTVTQDPGAKPVQSDAPKVLERSYTYTVPFDAAKVADLKKNNTNTKEEAASLTLVLPAQEYQPTLNAITTLWPGVAPELKEVDHGVEVQRLSDRINSLQEQIDQLKKQPQGEQDSTQITNLLQARQKAVDDRQMLNDLTQRVVITLKWETAAH